MPEKVDGCLATLEYLVAFDWDWDWDSESFNKNKPQRREQQR
jgi:hypothetical protein